MPESAAEVTMLVVVREAVRGDSERHRARRRDAFGRSEEEGAKAPVLLVI